MDIDKQAPETATSSAVPSDREQDHDRDIETSSPPLEDVTKSRWERSWPVIACGAGLFSDGYLASVIV